MIICQKAILEVMKHLDKQWVEKGTAAAQNILPFKSII